MLAGMSWKQFQGWMAYAELEPFGEERADLRAGIVAHVIANANRDPKTKPEPFKPSDFMPDFDGNRGSSKKPLTDAGAWKKMKAQAKAQFGGKQLGAG